jgi:hypothetical protein
MFLGASRLPPQIVIRYASCPTNHRRLLGPLEMAALGFPDRWFRFHGYARGIDALARPPSFRWLPARLRRWRPYRRVGFLAISPSAIDQATSGGITKQCSGRVRVATIVCSSSNVPWRVA